MMIMMMMMMMMIMMMDLYVVDIDDDAEKIYDGNTAKQAMIKVQCVNNIVFYDGGDDDVAAL